MSANPKPNRPSFALRLSVPGFHDHVFGRIRDMRAGIPRDRTQDVDRTFDAEMAIQEARTARMAAEIASKAKSDFLANMSHEVRTPVAAMVGLTTILLSTKLDNKQRQCLILLQDSAEALMAMLKGLLEIDKIESGIIAPEYAPLDLTALLEQITGLMSFKAQEKGIGLHLHCETGFPQTFVGDSGRIRQIVLNLVGNAIKFTETGGITVSLATGEGKNGRKQISISVTDTGIGIPPDKIDVIFERFIQASPAIAREYGGTGLGLSISKALAETMGGNIGVTSVMRKGSTFTLRLPLQPEESSNDTLLHPGYKYAAS